MKIIRTATLFLTVFAAVSLYVLFAKYQTIKKDAHLLSVQNQELSHNYRMLQRNYTFLLSGLGSKLDNVILTNSTGQKVELSEVIKNRKVIYRLQSDGCSSCLDSDFQILSRLSGFIPKQDVIIISDIENFRNIQTNAREYNFEAQIYSFKDAFNVSTDEVYQKVASFFIVEEDLSIIYLYQTAASAATEDKEIFVEKLKKLFSTPEHKRTKDYHEK